MQILSINQQINSPNCVEATCQLLVYGYKIHEMLGRGSFGVVFGVKKCRKTFAAKVMKSGVASRGEVRLWPRMKHRNILTLVKTIRAQNMDIFITPQIRCTLSALVYGNVKEKTYVSFGTTVLLLKDVLEGLCYLHRNKFCHLDLREDNVLVTEDFKKAIICDFGSLSESTYAVSKYLLPPYRSPPEAFHPSVHTPDVDGAAFDVWSFGMMALSIWTRKFLRFQIYKTFLPPTRRFRWYRYIYPYLLYVLQPNKFTTHLKMAFKERDLFNMTLALNLVRGCLMEIPGDRPSAADVLQHGLWWRKEEKTLPEDAIWNFDPKRGTIDSVCSALADDREVDCQGRCSLCLPWALRDMHAASVLGRVCCDGWVEEDYGAFVAKAIKTFKDPEYIRRKSHRPRSDLEEEKCALPSGKEGELKPVNQKESHPEVQEKKPILWDRIRGWLRMN